MAYRRTDVMAMVPRLTRLRCCGLLEFSGLRSVTSVEKAKAIRRAGFYLGRSGMVVATVTPNYVGSIPFLEKAGFKKKLEFVNPRTRNLVQVFMAGTVNRGGGIPTAETDDRR